MWYFSSAEVLFWNVIAETLSLNCGADLTVEEPSRGKKRKKSEEKNGIFDGFEGRIWTKFPNCPDPKKLRGGWRGVELTGNEHKSWKSIVNSLLFSVCLRGLSSSRRKSAWSCVSHGGDGVDAFFFSTRFFFYSRLFFLFLFSLCEMSREWGMEAQGASVCVYEATGS